MVQCAITVSSAEVPANVIGRLIDLGYDMLTEPVQLLPHVPEVLAEVGRDHRLLLLTKGDLVHQTRKITTSGLEHHFEYVEILLEKDPTSYRRILRHVGVEPDRFLMVGNSVRSDILPVLEIGGTRSTCRTTCSGTTSTSPTTARSSPSWRRSPSSRMAAAGRLTRPQRRPGSDGQSCAARPRGRGGRPTCGGSTTPVRGSGGCSRAG